MVLPRSMIIVCEIEDGVVRRYPFGEVFCEVVSLLFKLFLLLLSCFIEEFLLPLSLRSSISYAVSRKAGGARKAAGRGGIMLLRAISSSSSI
jgi:hypothetical protein